MLGRRRTSTHVLLPTLLSYKSTDFSSMGMLDFVIVRQEDCSTMSPRIVAQVCFVDAFGAQFMLAMQVLDGGFVEPRVLLAFARYGFISSTNLRYFRGWSLFFLPSRVHNILSRHSCTCQKEWICRSKNHHRALLYNS